MQSNYILLAITGIAGALLLLVIELIPGVRLWRKSLSATLLTLMTLLWATLPQTAQWPLSIWSPSTVSGGILLWDLDPALWGLGLVLALALSGAAWIEAVDSRAALPLSGSITVVALLTAWHVLAGGSLLTTLALWSVFDVLWGVAGLLAGNDGERMTFALFAHGVASLCLWAAYLLLSREGGGTLWWSLWPSAPTTLLLAAAAFLRIGLYPFQVVYPRRLRAMGPMTLVALVGPVLGLALLYRLLLLPANTALPLSIALMGLLSLLWGGARALLWKSKASLVWANYGLLGGITAAVALTGARALLLPALGTWLLSFALLLVMRRRDKRAIFWSWPAWIAMLLLLGVPPSPLGSLFRMVLAGATWGARVGLLVGWAFVAVALLRWARQPWEAHRSAPQETLTVTPLYTWQRAGQAGGFALPLGGLFWLAVRAPEATYDLTGLLLWGLMLLLALGLCWGIAAGSVPGSALHAKGRVSEWLRTSAGILEILDLQWLYRALLRGMTHLLSFVRVLFEVVEGSSALLWSLLVLLIIFLVAVNR
ncbi:MAG: hypothetical protein JW892_17450 [Anaerolineae bacterium]|nr:hypothetical protein [Anaerolineae bacterium]